MGSLDPHRAATSPEGRTAQQFAELFRRLGIVERAVLASPRWLAGRADLGNWLGGDQTATIALPTAWPTSHIAFVAVVYCTTAPGSCINRGSDVLGLADGTVSWNNPDLQQHFVANWISLGT